MKDTTITALGKIGGAAILLGWYLSETDGNDRVRGAVIAIAGWLMLGLDWLLHGPDSKVAAWLRAKPPTKGE